MVMIGTALQSRLVDAARRELGPGGDTLLRETIERELGTSLDKLSYAQIPALLAAMEGSAAENAGQQRAAALAAELDRLHADADAGLSGRLIGAVGKRLGPAAEPFLTNVCTHLNVTLDAVDRGHLSDIARAVQREATPLLGDDTARALAEAVEGCRTARPPGLAARLREVARESLGNDGAGFLERLCHDRLEIDLEELDVDGVALLARAVERHGGAALGSTRTAAFVATVRRALVSPAESLRARLLELAKRRIGPAGGDFLKRACTKNGLPFESLDVEHLMWLAEAVRADATPLLGKKNADELARDVRAQLTGKH
jgi:hypothetical protein